MKTKKVLPIDSHIIVMDIHLIQNEKVTNEKI